MGGRKPKDLELYRVYIIEQVMGGIIIESVVKMLKENFKVETSERTLYRRLKEWDCRQNIRLV